MASANRNASGRSDPLDADELLPILATAAALFLAAWLLPITATLTHSRHVPKLNAAEAIVGTADVAIGGHVPDPRRAYPQRVRAAMPAGGSWWLAATAPFAVLVLVAWVGWRRLEPLRARAVLGRRGYDPRGSDPREWARPRHLRELVVSGREPGRFTVGRLDRRVVAGDPEAHAALIAPTRSGKTTRCVIPWLLEHDGPAIVTSTKRDVFDATVAHRSRLGEVYVWDPGAPDAAGWSVLDGCDRWDFSLRQGLWLAHAVDSGDHHAARYWNQEAAKLLAPLLHAAALGPGTIETVIRWLDQQAVDEPIAILESAAAEAAQRQLYGVAGLDPRNCGTTYMSASSLLAAYRHPDVAAASHTGFRPERFVAGGLDTLYICAPPRRQGELAPLIVAMLSHVFEAAAIRTATRGPMFPTLRVLLDETANIAPLRDLPQHLSQAAGHGVRIATVWQSLAQARERYHDAADSILANSTLKLFLGPVTDDATRSYLDQLLGQELQAHEDNESWRPKASAQALQQLGGDRALLVSGSLPPSMVKLEPFWRSRDLPEPPG